MPRYNMVSSFCSYCSMSHVKGCIFWVFSVYGFCAKCSIDERPRDLCASGTAQSGINGKKECND